MGNKELTKTEKKYSKKEIFTLKSVFDDADVDQSGEIDVAELRKALNKSNLGSAADDMFRAIDKDGSKKIGFDEYLKVRGRARTRELERGGANVCSITTTRARAPPPFRSSPPGRRETLERPPPPPPRAPHASSASRAPSSHATRSPSHAVLSTTDRPTDRPTDSNECSQAYYRNATAAEIKDMMLWVYPPKEEVKAEVKRLTEAQRAEIKSIFVLYDANNNGVLDKKELAEALAATGYESDEVEEMFEEYDDDGSGEIDLDEFVRMLEHSYLK